jgi:hypothetical protein
MLATGVYMGFYLCLRSSEYISKTVVPLIDTHQLLSTDVQFVLRDARHTLVNSNQIRHYKYPDFKTVKFSMRHAKNIRNDFGVPIWFSTYVFVIRYYTSRCTDVCRLLRLQQKVVQHALNTNVSTNDCEIGQYVCYNHHENGSMEIVASPSPLSGTVDGIKQ